MSTSDYLDSLSIDQLRYARDEADRRIKKAEETPKKILWQAGGGLSFTEVFREEDWKEALEYFIKRIREDFDERFVQEVYDREVKPSQMRQYLPSLNFIYENEIEYEEWFK